MSDPTFFVVKITAEDGKLASGHTEAKRTAEFFVRADSIPTAINQVTQWILFKLGEDSPKLLRYLDVSARYCEEVPEPHQFLEMGLECFEPKEWVHFIKRESPPIPQLKRLEWRGADLHMTLDDNTGFVFKDAILVSYTYNYEPGAAMEKLDLDLKFARDVPVQVSAFTETKKPTPVEVLQHSLPRLPDGTINNCNLNNGADEAKCQMCNGTCPDKHKFSHPSPGVAIETPGPPNPEPPNYPPYGSHE